MKTNSLNRTAVPKGFTLSMAFMDALPVLLFCASAIVIAARFDSVLFRIGTVCCIAAGCGKVLWKLFIAAAKKNIWLLNRQMRFLMPAGFLLILLACFIDLSSTEFSAVRHAVFVFPSVIFFGACIVGMIAMGCFAGMLDSGNPRSYWIEQLTNTAAQACLLIGLLLL